VKETRAQILEAALDLSSRASPPYSLEVLQSNSIISHEKATCELGYKPRSIYESLADTVRWLTENLGYPNNREVFMPKDWQNKTAFITGASSGIGAATAETLAAKGMHVLLCARREDRLQKLKEKIENAGGKAKVMPADLSIETERELVFQKTQNSGGVEVLINNAGFGWYGYHKEMSWETAQAMLRVNVEATVHFSTLFLPEMTANKFGHVINVGSIAGGIPTQGNALYSATKAFLDAFTTALYRETRGTGVEISVICPGPVKTDFFDHSDRYTGSQRNPAAKMGVTAEVVAKQIWQLLQKPKRRVYVPAMLKITPWFEFSTGWIQDMIGPILLKKNYPG
jgi:short-subunit dehydrogenase